MNLFAWFDGQWFLNHRPPDDTFKGEVLMLALPPDTPVVPIDWVRTSEVEILP